MFDRKKYMKNYMKGYMKIYNKKHPERIRKWNKTRDDKITSLIRDEKEKRGGKCKKCGYKKSLFVLDFHHKNPRIKKFNISDAKTKHYPLKEIMKEMKKCDLICKNCHAEITYG